MQKKEIISWLRKYIEQENMVYQNQKYVKTWEDKIVEHSKPLKIEKKSGILGCIGSGIVVAIVGAIPCAIVFAIIWVIWDFIETITTNLRENPSAVLYSTEIIEKAAGFVIEDTDSFFAQHGVLGAFLGFLIIGFSIACIIGIIFVFLALITDINVPKNNKKNQEKYEESQKLLPKLQMMYDLYLKKLKDAEYQLA